MIYCAVTVGVEICAVTVGVGICAAAVVLEIALSDKRSSSIFDFFYVFKVVVPE